MHLNGEPADVCLLLVVDGFDAKPVGARRQLAEGYLIDTGLQTGPLLIIDALEICDMLRIVVSEGRELQGE